MAEIHSRQAEKLCESAERFPGNYLIIIKNNLFYSTHISVIFSICCINSFANFLDRCTIIPALLALVQQSLQPGSGTAAP
jgi:hypothetical protein